MTQDIEIVWRMLSKGYKARMCLDAKVYSETPRKFKHWWKQRIRWNIGGNQTMWKYKKLVFRNGMLGAFIIPFFAASMFLGIFGLGLFIYLVSRRILVSYLSTKYSLYASTTLLRFQDLTFSPSILNFFGAVLFILSLVFTLLGISILTEKKFRNRNILNILFYMIVYLSLYPLIMVIALYKLATGKYSW
jgi:cellulose synthase/poly-beta-1,6-N-acetylglucosamine synthase-like glycosyltransferase